MSDYNYTHLFALAGGGLGVAGGISSDKYIAQSGGASAKAALDQARLYRQNAIYEGINSEKRAGSVRKAYKRIQDRIDATTRASGFKSSGELKREAELNKIAAIEESRFGSAMMQRNYNMAAKRSLEAGKQAIRGIRYQQRANLFDTASNLLGLAVNYKYST